MRQAIGGSPHLLHNGLHPGLRQGVGVLDLDRTGLIECPEPDYFPLYIRPRWP